MILHPVLFRPLLPPDVRVAELPPSADAYPLLLPAERAAVANAVEKRRREFATARMLARPLLADLGVPDFALLPSSDRAPAWPDGVVGSITHCNTHVAVAVARSQAFAALGLDVEPAGPLPDGVGTLVLDATEAMTRMPHGDRVIFSAKEAAYKAIYPITRLFLEFADMHVELGDGTFVATLNRDAAPFGRGMRLHGVWRIADGHIATAVVLPR